MRAQDETGTVDPDHPGKWCTSERVRRRGVLLVRASEWSPDALVVGAEHANIGLGEGAHGRGTLPYKRLGRYTVCLP